MAMKVKLDRKAVDKLYDTLEKNILPSFITPRGIKLRGIARADSQAYEIRAITQAKKDAEEIKDGRALLSETGKLIRIDHEDRDSSLDDTSLSRALKQKRTPGFDQPYIRKEEGPAVFWRSRWPQGVSPDGS